MAKRSERVADRAVKVGHRLILPDHYYSPSELVQAGFESEGDLAMMREQRTGLPFHRIGPFIWYRGSDIIRAVESGRIMQAGKHEDRAPAA